MFLWITGSFSTSIVIQTFSLWANCAFLHSLHHFCIVIMSFLVFCGGFFRCFLRYTFFFCLYLLCLHLLLLLLLLLLSISCNKKKNLSLSLSAWTPFCLQFSFCSFFFSVFLQMSCFLTVMHIAWNCTAIISPLILMFSRLDNESCVLSDFINMSTAGSTERVTFIQKESN